MMTRLLAGLGYLAAIVLSVLLVMAVLYAKQRWWDYRDAPSGWHVVAEPDGCHWYIKSWNGEGPLPPLEFTPRMRDGRQMCEKGRPCERRRWPCVPPEENF